MGGGHLHGDGHSCPAQSFVQPPQTCSKGCKKAVFVLPLPPLPSPIHPVKDLENNTNLLKVIANKTLPTVDTFEVSSDEQGATDFIPIVILSLTLRGPLSVTYS